ncbi:MAG: FAD-binding protein [Alphaproteobacteria bacterium]|nr:FAD-binding protein [Alphaproteobacteria bacterium]
MDIAAVRDQRDVEEAVQAALRTARPLEIIGHGSRRAVGQILTVESGLDVSALNAVRGYEPGELILTVEAGAPLGDVMSLIDSKRQQFAFEPMDCAALLGSSGSGTVAGMIASGFAGPRRVTAGGVRDHLLGAAAVSGFGESFKTGGKVVKNVTGYDLCKLLAGSWGTLAVMTEVTLKVMPQPESAVTLLLRGLDDAAANRAMTVALASPFAVSGAAHVPAGVLSDALRAVGAAGEALTALRLEGTELSVRHRLAALAGLLGAGAGESVGDEVSAALWRALRDVLPFAATAARGDWPVWRIVCAPAAASGIGLELVRRTGAELFYDWGGGLIWAAVPPSQDAHAMVLRSSLKLSGAHATLIRATAEQRAQVDVFQPLSGVAAALHERVRISFDPKSILNRGRLRREPRPRHTVPGAVP